jgi:hypothetical protein
MLKDNIIRLGLRNRKRNSYKFAQPVKPSYKICQKRQGIFTVIPEPKDTFLSRFLSIFTGQV